MRREYLAVWPDQAVLSPVRDIRALNYCTKLFHPCFERSIVQHGTKHRGFEGQTPFQRNRIFCRNSCRVSRFFPHFSAFFANPGDRHPPPPPCWPGFWATMRGIIGWRWRRWSGWSKGWGGYLREYTKGCEGEERAVPRVTAGV